LEAELKSLKPAWEKQQNPVFKKTEKALKL
jgi:hypothetical protein